MPCQYDLYDRVSISQTEYDRLKGDLDDLTRMLCELCGYLEKNNFEINLTDIKEWWEEHKKKDELRKIVEENKERIARENMFKEYKRLKEKLEL